MEGLVSKKVSVDFSLLVDLFMKSNKKIQERLNIKEKWSQDRQ